MGGIWEIIPPQSGPHSWLSQASRSILIHTHTFTHTELWTACCCQTCFGHKDEDWRGTGKSVSVCLIGFFQIRLNPDTCLSTFSSIPWSTGHPQTTWESPVTNLLAAGQGSYAYSNFITSTDFKESAAEGDYEYLCCQTSGSPLISVCNCYFSDACNCHFWSLVMRALSLRLPVKSPSPVVNWEPDWPGKKHVDLVYRFRTQKHHWYGSCTVAGNRSSGSNQIARSDGCS